MSDWKRSSRELQERFDAALPDDPAIERRKMFGYPCAFVNGNFFSGLFEESVVARLPGGMHEEFAETRGAEGFNPMGSGRGMSGWFVLPAEVAGSDKRLGAFLAAALTEVARLPPKEKAASKKKPTAKKASAAKKKPAAKKSAAKKSAAKKKPAATGGARSRTPR